MQVLSPGRQFHSSDFGLQCVNLEETKEEKYFYSDSVLIPARLTEEEQPGWKSAQKHGGWPFVWLWSAFEKHLAILYSGVLCLS